MQFKSLWVAGSLASALLMTSNAFAAADAWQGFYAGAALGGREQEAQWQQDGKFAYPDGETFDIGVVSKNNSKDSATYIALYGGYNWAVAERVLAGVELAGGYANNKSEKNRIDIPIPFDLGVYATVKTDWDASLRGRLGFLLTPSVLLYGTGGVAITRMNTTGYCSNDFPILCGAPTKTDDSKTLVGWTAGFGAETQITGNLLARAEYQYSDYGSESFWAPEWKKNQAYGVHNKVDLTTQSLSLGLAYHF
ncbi:MAG: outer membrane beta-barrel protein [Pseudomonas sp.]